MARFGSEYFSAENNFGALTKIEEGRRRKNMPIFWEFVRFVLAKGPDGQDEHWAPINRFCSLCVVKYNMIVKFEELDTDLGDLMTHLGIGSLEVTHDLHMNSYSHGSRSQSPDITRLYMETLSDDLVQGLFDLYKLDFRLYDYTFELRGKVYK